ncbi:MAG: DUF4344 domain-containing metallopeptidase [Methylotenera sp.]|nr:DUF4344 domain-containing metallopeptidase [Methylotenera sp.]MDD4925410.1 DUF4344 domain-containing metallopeptidase [Methylotenera sp.]
MQYLSLVLIFFMFFGSAPVQAEVFVAPKMATEPITENVVVNAGTYKVIPLGNIGNANQSYKITINTGNEVYRDLTAFIVDSDNLVSFKLGYRFKGTGYSKAQTPFIIEETAPDTKNRYLVIDNTYAMVIKKKVQFTIETKFDLTAEQQEKTKKLFSGIYAGLKKNLIFPDFDIHIKPCAMANAYSETTNGNIYFCSELIDQIARNGNDKAFISIFLHEAGHSLLNLWGIPGYNNEDIADEFSTYILMSGGPNGYQFLDASLQFWQGRNSAGEALNMLQNGSRHSLSIQRMRNIKENMLAGETFIKRWNKLLYEHSTDEALGDVIKKPMPGADVELATKILNSRNYQLIDQQRVP